MQYFFLIKGTSNIRCWLQTSYYVVRRVCAVNPDCAQPWDVEELLQADRRKSYIQNIAADAQPSPLFDVQPATPPPI